MTMSLLVLVLYLFCCIFFVITVSNFYTITTSAFSIIRYKNTISKNECICSKITTITKSKLKNYNIFGQQSSRHAPLEAIRTLPTTTPTTSAITSSTTTLLLLLLSSSDSNHQKQRITRFHSYNSLSVFSLLRKQNEDTTTAILESSSFTRIDEDDTRTSVVDSLEINNNQSTSLFLGYNDSDVSSKGIVLSLTNFVNSISKLFDTNTLTNKNRNDIVVSTSSSIAQKQTLQPPQSVNELMERIRIEYIEHNYLWTGNIDVSSFTSNCQFIDPTLSFTGIDTFVTNVQNLQPLLSKVISNTSMKCQSILQNIQLYDNENEKEHDDSQSSYIETKWIMYGRFDKLFYKPIINVTGRTKFWYKVTSTDTSTCATTSNSTSTTTASNNSALQVYLYDEKWEIPAYQALLQLITPQW